MYRQVVNKVVHTHGLLTFQRAPSIRWHFPTNNQVNKSITFSRKRSLASLLLFLFRNIFLFSFWLFLLRLEWWTTESLFLSSEIDDCYRFRRHARYTLRWESSRDSDIIQLTRSFPFTYRLIWTAMMSSVLETLVNSTIKTDDTPNLEFNFLVFLFRHCLLR